MLLCPDGALDNLSVESVGDQADDEVDLLESLVQSSIITDIEGDGLGVLEAGTELLGGFEGTTG